MKDKKGVIFIAVRMECAAIWKKIALVILILLLIGNSSFAATRTWAGAGGVWNAANWGGTLPVAGDDLVFTNAGAIIVTGVPTLSVNSISIQGAGNVTLQGGAGIVLTINNIDATVALNIINGRSLTIGGGTAITAVNLTLQTVTTSTTIAGTLANTANSTIILNAAQILTFAGTGVFTANVGTNTINGTISNAGTVTGTLASLSFAAGSTYIHNENGGTVPTATWAATSNSNITGLTNAAPAGINQTFGNLTIDGSASLTAAVTVTASGGVTVAGNLVITGQSAVNIISFDPAANNLSVTGTTTINQYGRLIDSNLAGANTFTGLVTVGANGTWNNTGNSPVTFQSGITNNGTFTAGTGVQTFNTNSQALTGTFSIPNVTVTGGAVVLTNNNSLTVNTALAGTGGITQAANATLTIGFTGVVGITTLTADANGNTVNYNFAGVQTIKTPAVAASYYNLILSNSGVKTLAAATTVNGDLTVSGSATLADGTFGITGAIGKTFTLGSGTTYTSTKITDPCFPTNMTYALDAASTVNLNGTGTFTFTSFPTSFGNLLFGAAAASVKTLPASTPITINGNLTINLNNTLADNGNTITVKGNVTNNGTHSGVGKMYLNSGAGVHAISGATSAFGNFELDDAIGATITGTGTTTISGTLTIIQGTLTLNAFTTAFAVNGATTIGNGATTGALTIANAAVTRTFTGIVTIGVNGTWNNSSNATITFQGGITNNGTFTAGTGVQTFNTNSQSLTGTFSIPSVTVTGAAVVLTNNNSLTINTVLGGTGGLTQAANATLNIGFTGAVGINTLTAGANGNTVVYNFAGAQTIKTPFASTYYNLVTDISGIKTLATANTVSGNLTINNGTLADGGFALTVNGNVINNGLHTGAGSITLSGGSAAHNISGTGSFQNVILNDANGAVLGSNTAINGTLTLTNGLLLLGNYNLSMATAASAIGGAPSSSRMIVINGTGQMQKFFAAGASAFTYPIGDNASNYTPGTLTFTANTLAGSVGIKVANTKHPANSQINNYINRYWSFSAPALTNYTYSAAFQYTASDVVGSEAYILAQRYDNGTTTWTTDISSSVNTVTHVLTTGSLTQATGKLDNNDFTAYNGGTNLYYWSKATGNWSAAATWEVTSTPVDPGVGLGIPATTAPTNLNSTGITIRTGNNVTVNNSYTVDNLTVIGTLTVSAGQTLTIANGGYSPDMQVNTTGIVTNSGTITPTGTISFTGNSTYNHTQNGGTVPTATWSATSTLSITLGVAATVNGLAQSFGNFTYTGGAFILTLGQGPTIQGNLTVSAGTLAVAANTVNLTGNLSGAGTISFTTGTLNIGGNNTITTLTAGAGTVNYNGVNQTVLTTVYNNLQISNSGIKTLSNATPLTVGGNLDISNSSLAFRNNAIQTVTVTGNLSGNGTLDISPGNLVHVLNLGGATNTIGTLTTGAAASIINYTLAGAQTVFASPNYQVLNINGAGGNIKTLQGDITVKNNLTVAAATVFNLGTTASTINVNGTATITGSLIFDGTTDKTMTVNGIFSMNNVASVVDMSGSTNHALYLRGAANVFTAGGTFTAGAGTQTVYYDGDQAQTILGVTYNNLYIGDYNPGAIAARIKTLGGATVVNSNLNITGVAAVPTVTLQLAGNAFTVNGTTNINAYGILNDNVLAGANLFVGLVTINANGQWQTAGNPPFTFQGGLSFDGSAFVGGAGNYTFNTNNQYISGGQSITITNIVTTGVGITLTNRNTAGLTAGSISGTGNFTNGDVGFNSILYLVGGGNPLALTGTVDFATNPNTVNYQAAVAQTIGANNFYNLITSGARTNTSITLANGGIIGIAASFNPAATFTTGSYIIANNTINFNGTIPQLILSSVPNPYNNITISGNSTKTLTGNVILPAAGVLNLNGGVLELNNANLTILNNAANAIQGAFSATNMIATDGTGYLIKNAASAQTLYPIGSNGYYSPFTLSAYAPAGGTFSVRAVPVAINPSYIKVYWDILSSIGRTSATATFQYDPAESNGASPNMTYSPDGGVTWQSPPTTGTPSYGTNSFTITGTAPFVGWWTMGFRSFYSYQTGDWNTPSTWTTDPSGTLQIGNAIPGYNDNVVILSGRTVSLSGDIATQKLGININAGGYLDIGTHQFTSGLLVLSGQGTLQLSSANFPVVTTNNFILAGGGTTEYDANINLPAIPAAYNNLTINTSGSDILKNNLSLNGNLYVKNGTFQINDNLPGRYQLTINGNVTVNNTGSIAVGTGITNTTNNPLGIATIAAPPFIDYYDAQSHRIVIKGDFINNGTARFTNLANPVYNAFPPIINDATTGFATVYFQGSTSNTLTCNGQTDFYNLVLDKGIDPTYSLTINPSAYGNFRLFGANVATFDIVGATNANPNLKKALWIRNGTLVLAGSTVIPSLSEGTTVYPATPTSDYFIPANAALSIDGGSVIVLSTADDYSEVNAAYGLAVPDNVTYGINSSSGGSGLSVLGKLQINSGYLSTRESSGLLYWSYNLGQIVVNGGTIDTKQIHSPEPGNIGLINYGQNNGMAILRGRFQNTINYTLPTDLANPVINTIRAANNIDAAVGTFYLNTNPANGFAMSNGTITIYDVCGTPATPFAFQQSCPTSNINVSGGTLQITPTAGTGFGDADYYIYTTSPIGNLTVNPASGATQSVQLNTSALTILKNISLQSGSTIIANGLDVNIGGNFTIANNAVYTTGANRTLFNGTGNQTFTVNTGAPLALNKLIINKAATDALLFAGTQNIINIADSLMIYKGKLNDNGNTLNASGGVYNSGTHLGTGKIAMVGITAQTIDGDGTGTFNNLDLNNTTAVASPISNTSNITVNGALNLVSDKIFTIGSNKLSIGASGLITSTPGFSNTCFIQTNGQVGDGGITKIFSSITAFTFPVGAYSTKRPATYAYTPAIIGFSIAPIVYGSITVNPVGIEHPNTTTKNLSLTYYWHVKSNNFTLAPNSVNHSYVYSQTDVNSIEGNYVPGRFDNSTFTWTSGTTASVNTTSNTIGIGLADPFMENTNNIDGDYTAGNSNPVNPFGIPKIFYSYNCPKGSAPGRGQWSQLNTWSLTGHTGVQTIPAAKPGPSDIVLIGNNDSIWLASALAAPNLEVEKCANLQIEKGSALDIGYNPGCIFSVVSSSPLGNGNFRLTTSNASGTIYVFPSGDFTDFNVNRGTTEFYTTNPAAGPYFILPANVTSYGTVILSPLGGSNLILPNNAYTTIYGDLICKGQNADSWLAMTWNGTYGVVVPKTVHVKGNLNILGGEFIFYQNNATLQNVIVDGDVIVAPAAGIDVYAATTNNTMSIGGSLINNSDNSLAPFGTRSWVRFLNGANKCDVTFNGSNSAFITNTAGVPQTIFNNVIVNKGNSQATILTVNIGGTLTTNGALAAPNDNWLTLQNGTFIYNRTGNFNITTGSTFTIPATAGLTINTPSNVNIAQGNVSTNTLYLSGKLTLAAGNTGNVYIGNTANNQHNDIEYSSGGAATIEVDGGNLIVNGAIRRSPSNPAGVLSYTQTGGQVIILGNSALPSNSKFGIANNAGSHFNISGGTITIVRGGGINYGDLYLRPQTSSVTGGTIIFSQVPPPIIPVIPTVNAVQNYLLDANIPLNNLTITGKNAAPVQNATVGLMVDPLTIKGTLLLSNANSILTSNNLNITIGGDLNNNGTYNYGTNLTTFNGNTQNITGSSITNFYDLNISPITSVTENSNATVNRNLTIGNGTLVLGNYLITLLGNLTNNNNCFYSDNNTASSGISLAGSSQQIISGTGSFGRLEINNNAGALANNDLNLQNNLALTKGNLNIGSHLLSLGLNSNLTGAPFSVTKMIISDGVSSSLGVRKFFNTVTATPTQFSFPVGVSGKYTPAIFSYTDNATIGYIQVNPVNSTEPAVLDPSQVLKYYWGINSSGISGFNGNVLLQYLPGDVQGTESDYIAARLLTPGTYWSKATPGPSTDNVDEINHQITFDYAGTSNLNGEYTAGIDAAIPSEVPSYQSINDGNWSDATIWQPIGASPPCPDGGPNGFIVIINNVVTTDVNYCSAYQTTINDTLIIVSPTFGHNLGAITGSGTLHVESGNLPAGNYTSFIDCSNNGTIEYGGTGNYTIIAAQYSSLPNLFFTGTGKRTLPNKDLTICNRLVIDGPTLDNSTNNRKLTILGSMERYNSGAFQPGTGANATVSFAGTSAQIVGGPTGNLTFYSMEINNSAGLNIGNNGLITINGNLLLTNGTITTTSTNRLYIANTSAACVIPSGGSASSFIDGPLLKAIPLNSNFTFPLGQGTIWGHQFILTDLSAGTGVWTAQYFSPNPTYTSMTPPLQAVNDMEYWGVKCTSSRNGKISLGWSPTSDLTPLMTQNGLIDMNVAQYIAGSWQQLASTASGDNSNGNVITNSGVSLGVVQTNFTIASVTSTLPRASLAPIGPVCGNAGIPVKFVVYSPINLYYVLNYTIDGIVQPAIQVNSLPFTLPTPVAGTYQLTGFTYNNGTLPGVVDPGTVVAYTTPTTSNAGLDQSWCGLSGTTLQGNNPAPNTGLWTIVNGSGGVILSPTLFNSVFNGQLGASYTLQWTISSGACQSSDQVVIAFPVAPQRPSAFNAAPTPVCQGLNSVTYTVPNIPAVTYNWSYSGTGVTINGSSNSVSLDFGATATSGTLSVTATNSCGTSAPRTVVITVNLAPTASAGADINVCTGMAVLTMTGAAEGGTYSGNIWSGGIGSGNWTQNANPALATFTPTVASGSFTATLTVTGSGGCTGINPTSTRTITWATVTSISSDPSNSTIFAGQNTIFNVGPGGTGPFTYVWEVSTDGGGSWNPASGGVYSGENTASLSITGALLSMNNYYYHCIVTGTCGNATSNYAILTVNPTATASLSGATSICVGQSATLTVTLTGTPNWSITYSDGTSSYNINNIAASPYTFNVSPSTTTTYTLTAVSDANGAGTISGGGVIVTVTPVPATGPLYRKPNQ